MDFGEAIEQLSEKQELLATLMESKKCPMELEDQAVGTVKIGEGQKIEPGFHRSGSRQGLKVVLLWPQTVPLTVLARLLMCTTWMKQCPRPP